MDDDDRAAEELLFLLQEQVSRWPARKYDVIEATLTSELPDEEKWWIADNLPDARFDRPADVLKALEIRV